jgi:ribosomal protein L11 methylase PrmA
MKRFNRFYGVFLIVFLTAMSVYSQENEPKLDAPYIQSSPGAIKTMFRLAKITKRDVVYDLGCGDGRIVIAAAKQYGVRAVGIDIDPERIKEARANARRAGVAHKVKFIQADLFKSDFREATIVTLYLLPEVNLKLRPILLEQLKPGARILSNAFSMGDWKPEQSVETAGTIVHLWTVPKKKLATITPGNGK